MSTVQDVAHAGPPRPCGRHPDVGLRSVMVCCLLIDVALTFDVDAESAWLGEGARVRTAADDVLRLM